MGFTWGVGVYVEYCIPLKLPTNVSYWYMLKRLAEFEPGYLKRAHSAMVTGDPSAKTLMNRARQSIVVEIDSNEYDEEEVYKEVASPTPLEECFHYNPKLDECECREHDLKDNCPELLGEAFEYAASKVLGEGHGITLTNYHGSADGQVDAPAKDDIMFVTYKMLRIQPEGEGFQVGRIGANVPWGVLSMPVPAEPPGVAMKMQTLLSTFGLESEGPAGWRVITVADGG